LNQPKVKYLAGDHSGLTGVWTNNLDLPLPGQISTLQWRIMYSQPVMVTK